MKRFPIFIISKSIWLLAFLFVALFSVSENERTVNDVNIVAVSEFTGQNIISSPFAVIEGDEDLNQDITVSYHPLFNHRCRNTYHTCRESKQNISKKKQLNFTFFNLPPPLLS